MFTGITLHSYEIESKPLGMGGEGIIYIVKNDKDKVIKVFKNHTYNKYEKIREMIGSKPETTEYFSFIWPLEMVFDEKGFVGYLMDQIDWSKKYIDLNDSSLYELPLLKKIEIAKNLCMAVNALHELNHVIGDFNPKNFLVELENQKILLMDSDSYQITRKRDGKIFRCDVGVPDYLAPEIHCYFEKNPMMSFRNAEEEELYSIQTDLFALAVCIFMLLMNGWHPFSCAVNFEEHKKQQLKISIQVPEIIENIKNENFIFLKPSDKLTFSCYAPKKDTIPTKLLNLFKRAFFTEKSKPISRPTALEWVDSLSEVLADIRKTVNESKSNLQNEQTFVLENSKNYSKKSEIFLQEQRKTDFADCLFDSLWSLTESSGRLQKNQQSINYNSKIPKDW